MNWRALAKELDAYLGKLSAHPPEGMSAVNWANLRVVDIEECRSLLEPGEPPDILVRIEEAESRELDISAVTEWLRRGDMSMTATTCCPICEGTGTRYYEWHEQPQRCALCRGTGRSRLAALPAAMIGAPRVEAVVVQGGKEAALLFDHRMYGGG
jgi:hypothetical protein